MGIVLPGWPDAEDVVMSLLAPIAPATVETPADLEVQAPMIRVRRVGGADDGISDRPLVEVAVYGRTYQQARLLAEQVRQVVLASGCTKVSTQDYPGGVLIDKAETATPPTHVPYENPDVRRKTATYRFVWRRPR